MDQIFKHWLPSVLDESTCGSKGPTAIAIANVVSAFSFLGAGATLAAALMLVEIVVQCVWRPKGGAANNLMLKNIRF